MLGLGYISKQTYSYDNHEQLIKYLDITEAPKFKIEYEEKIIEYTIDRKQWIRLNDLIFWIQIKFVKFHVGQLLDLFENILNYVQIMQQKGIDHQYLDSNRIWLVLRPESEYPSIIHSKLIYDITFTGYQCPFYENLSIQAEYGIIKIKEIILEIVQSFLDNQLGLIKKEGLIQQEIQIFEDLRASLLSFGEIQQVLALIHQQKQQFQYKSIQGELSFDEGTSYLSLRKQRVKSVFQAFQINLQKIENVDQLITEEYFQIIPQFFVKTIDNYIYEVPEFDAESFLEKSLDKTNSFNAQILVLIKNLLNEEIKKSSNQHKFVFSEEEIQKMEIEILDVLMNKGVICYFNNSFFFQYQENQFEFKLQQVSKEINRIVDGRFTLCLHLKILNVIQELI